MNKVIQNKEVRHTTTLGKLSNKTTCQKQEKCADRKPVVTNTKPERKTTDIFSFIQQHHKR